MGLLFNLSTDADREIIRHLNRRFNRQNLATLQNYVATKNINPFGGDYSLKGVALWLSLWPKAGPNRPKKRWFFFLQKVLTDDVKKKILNALSQAVVARNANGKCTYTKITFDGRDGSAQDLMHLMLELGELVNGNSDGIAPPTDIPPTLGAAPYEDSSDNDPDDPDVKTAKSPRSKKSKSGRAKSKKKYVKKAAKKKKY